MSEGRNDPEAWSRPGGAQGRGSAESTGWGVAGRPRSARPAHQQAVEGPSKGAGGAPRALSGAAQGQEGTPWRGRRGARETREPKLASCRGLPEADLGPPRRQNDRRRQEKRAPKPLHCRHLRRLLREPFRKVPEALTSGFQRLFSPSRFDERERARRRGNGGKNPRRRAPQGCPSGSLKTRVTLETHASRGPQAPATAGPRIPIFHTANQKLQVKGLILAQSER